MEGAKGAGGGKLKLEAQEVESLVLETAKQSRDIVTEIKDLATSLELGSGKFSSGMRWLEFQQKH